MILETDIGSRVDGHDSSNLEPYIGCVTRTVLGCQVDDATLEAWAKILVFAQEPIFLSDDLRQKLPGSVNMISRDEFNRRDNPLEFKDAYLTYSVGDAPWVALLEPAQFRRCRSALQLEVMNLQAELGRGQIYSLEFAQKILGTEFSKLEPDVFADRVAIRFDAWWSLSRNARHNWLEAVVIEDSLQAIPLETTTNPIVRELANSFATSSGPNCFATALASVTDDLTEARAVSLLWLHQEPFFAGLQSRGYSVTANPPDTGDVIVWFDSSNLAQHACALIAPGLVLNKDAQCWHAPRQILKLESVLANWAEAELEIRVFSKSEYRQS
jgi:hypothetical protein